MKKILFPKNTILKNVFILGLSGIIAKTFDFLFRAYYSRALGAEGMGLLSLGFSMHGVMLTFATAGFGVAVSKITSEYMAQNRYNIAKRCMRCALFGVSVFSLVVMLITFVLSTQIAENILGDKRVSLSLCTLVPSIIFMGLSYCFKGFFYASRKVLAPASSEILEQIVKFIAIYALLKVLLPYGTQYGCAAVFGGISIGEFSSCAYLGVIYIKEERKIKSTPAENDALSQRELVCELLGISIPSMVTSLCCSFLRMQEEVLIVSALERGNLSHSEAVSSLGLLKGMAMPLLIMPLNLLGSVMSLLVPEISRAGVIGQRRLRSATLRIYKVGIPIGLVIGSMFLIFGEQITYAVYGSYDASRLVVWLSPLCPIMFADSLSCSVLNGLGKQKRLLLFSLLDFCLRFILIYFAIPYGKTAAFAFMVAVSNIFTCTLSCSCVASLISQGKMPSFKLTKKLKYGMLDK